QVDESIDAFEPRHQKLQNVLSWSYDLLTADEQKLFAQLPLFSGGFFTEAVEKICPGKQVLGNLFSLRAKSLVQTEIVQQKKRYFLLEPVRQYAEGKLSNKEQMKKAHAEYFCLWAKEQDAKLKGVEQSQALSEMALELDNFRAAMDSASELGDWKLLGGLGIALSRFFDIRGLWSEGMQRLKQVEEALRSCSDKALLAKVVRGLSRFYQLQGYYEEARNLDNESLLIQREIGDKQGIAETLNHLGIIAENQSAYEEASRLYTESLQMFRELEDKQGIAEALNCIGLIAWRQGAYEEARPLHTETLQIFRELGDKWGIAASMGNLGIIAADQGVYDEAKQLYTDSLKIFRELGHKCGIAASLNNLGAIAVKQEAYKEARRFHTESLQIQRELGDKHGITISIHQFGKLVEAEGDSAQAVLFLLVAARFYEEMKVANSKEAVEVQETLTEIQEKISVEQFDRIKRQAEAMSDDEVVELALSWGE
ncbi:tetratricopeptide repeat protein, partial [bacterium]|nr:tetratricopeptide repeat protein [bacterium]